MQSDPVDYWRRFWDAWKPGARWEIEEIGLIGEDRVVACGRLRASGRSSGIEMTMPVFHGWTVREGIVERFVVGADRAAAVRGVNQ
jgi:hypothetical protein